ncbi:MAG TPA: hypothetical protein VFQ48_06505 [Pseudonocardiaceae bacterium]|nr:hypothetical protein [Pseudonocardiaceae bacterium]
MTAAQYPPAAGPGPELGQVVPPSAAYGRGPGRPEPSETKTALRTTELVAYLAAVVAVVITALAVGADEGGVDPFNAEQALRYITFLTIGYMISRGLAKAGSRNFNGDR